MTKSEAGKLGGIKAAKTLKLIRQEKEQLYYLNPRLCVECSAVIKFERDKRSKFCCQTCSAINANKLKKKTVDKYTQTCLNCNNKFHAIGKDVNAGKSIFCCIYCHKQHQQKQYIQRWKNNEESGVIGETSISKRIRRYMFEKYDNKCARCKWSQVNINTGKIPLEVDHIDGDYTNNLENNLILLCPSCHSLTPTYKGANSKNNKPKRNRKNIYG